MRVDEREIGKVVLNCAYCREEIRTVTESNKPTRKILEQERMKKT